MEREKTTYREEKFDQVKNLNVRSETTPKKAQPVGPFQMEIFKGKRGKVGKV